jgi:hypothetical protein
MLYPAQPENASNPFTTLFSEASAPVFGIVIAEVRRWWAR